MVRALNLAALGFLILAASPAENKHNQRDQRQGASNAHQGQAAPPIVEPSPRAPSAEPAKKGCEGEDNSNLSCEALSAKAAVRQARDADWQAYSTVAGVLVGLLTLFAAVWAARWARAAAEHTGRGADIAAENRRPWVALSLKLVGPASFRPGGLYFDIDIIVKNVGSSPAYDVWICADTFNIMRQMKGAPEAFLKKALEEAKASPGRGFALAPDEEVPRSLGMKLSRENFGAIQEVSHYSLPLVVASATYRATTDAKLIAQTGKGFVVQRTLGGIIDEGDGDVPLDQLSSYASNALGTAT